MNLSVITFTSRWRKYNSDDLRGVKITRELQGILLVINFIDFHPDLERQEYSRKPCNPSVSENIFYNNVT